jgi:hypothetical protein
LQPANTIGAAENAIFSDQFFEQMPGANQKIIIRYAKTVLYKKILEEKNGGKDAAIF